MRRRRAERCLVRADLAFHAGFMDEARAATDEARDLDPDLPALVELEALLARATAPVELPPRLEIVEPPPVAADRAETRRQTAFPVEVAPLARGASPAADLPLHVEVREPTPPAPDRGDARRRVQYALALALGCACVALVAAASLGWHAVLRPPTPEPVNTALRGNVTLPADPVLDTAPAAGGSATPGTTPIQTPEPEPSAISTSGETPSAVAEAPRKDDAVKLTPEPQRRDDAVKPPAPAAPPRSERVLTEGTPAARFTGTASIPAPTAAVDPAVRPAREEPLPSFKAPAVEPVPLSASALPVAGSIPAAPAPEPAPAAPSRARSPEPAASVVDAQAAIRTTLSRYEAAYSGLNVSAARAVWPAVDERALARAFDGLSSQRVALDKCDVAVSGATARATCSGSADWTPKVGGGQRHQNRRWAFELANAGGTWQIVRADTR